MASFRDLFSEKITGCKFVNDNQYLLPGRDLNNVSNVPKHPSSEKQHTCTAMVLNNLAEPMWVSVTCEEKLVKTVYCLMNNIDISKNNDKQTPDLEVCSKESVLAGKSCIAFLWKYVPTVQIPPSRKYMTQCDHLLGFHFLFDAVAGNFPPIFAANPNQVVSYSRCSNTYKYKCSTLIKSVDALYIKEGKKMTISRGGNMFLCHDNVTISTIYICDGKKDCPTDASDETGCHCNNTNHYSSKCKYLTQESGKVVCTSFYISTGSMNCISQSFSETYFLGDKQNSTSDGFTNIMFDKLPKVPEVTYENLKMNLRNHCIQKGQLACKNWIHKCYNISQICFYHLNEKGFLLPCTNGEHTQSCEKFECSMKFKCPGYYCIPWSYLGDGKWDCPYGLDELSKLKSRNDTTVCHNSYKCRAHQKCLHLGDVCDGSVDCPTGDDEHFCSLHNVGCPKACESLLFSIRCVDMNQVPKETLPFLTIWIQVGDLTNNIYHIFKDAIVIAMIKTNLTNVCLLRHKSFNLLLLDASLNLVSMLEVNCFQTSFKLKKIQLGKNQISQIDQKAFSNLTSLLLLNLTDNCLSFLSKQMFASLSKIEILSLNRNSLAKIQRDVFNEIQLEILETDNHYFCCVLSSNTKCTAIFPWHISCADLLPNNATKITFYSISSTLVIANILSVILQKVSFLKGFEKTGAFGTTVACVNVCDVICAVPLLSVWAADLHYLGQFYLHEGDWRSSPLCYFVYATTLAFCFLSPSTLSFLTMSRLMVVLHPIDTHFKETRFVLQYLISIFAVTSCIACGLTILAWFLIGKVPIDLCSPFIDPTDTVAMTKILIWTVSVVQLSAAIFIIIAYIILVKSLQSSQQEIQHSVSK